MTFQNTPCECTDPSRVHTIYAWVAEDASGEEGIVAIPTALGVMPALGADIERVMSYRDVIQRMVAPVRKKPVTLRRFHVTGDIETIP